MAAFINAIAEGGTRGEALYFVQLQRRDNGMDRLSDDDFDGWSKEDLVQELIRLWNQRPQLKV